MAKPGAGLVSGADLENLPSFGMSSYFNIASGAETMAMLKNIGAGKSPTGRTLKPAGAASLPGPSSVDPSTTLAGDNEQHIQVIVQDDTGNEEQDPDEYGFKFAAATAPIASTVDTSQIMETEQSGGQDMKMNAVPVLRVKLMTNYMRFRYMSEKCPKKKGGHKTRQYETEDVDKHCLAEVWVDNYDGVGKIVAYCVDSTGKLHPYNLFGDGCHKGVYVCKFKFRQGKIARLNKVSVTTPKAKEYQQNLQSQLSYLGEAGIHDVKFCSPDDIQDKQIVYVMFKVILDGHNGEILSQISTPLQNKKKGKEFLIEDVEPVCCPAKIPQVYEPWKYRVMLHVTEGTAFPSEVGLKVRERNSNRQIIWEAEPEKDSIKTVKQCVVKFIPPPYRNPETKKDVEVEICLYDKKTQNETEPFKFIYQGSDNVTPEMNIENKAKKRKLTEDIDISSVSFVPDVQGERKTLTALHSRPNSASSDSSTGSVPDNTVSYQETQSIQAVTENQSNLEPAGIEEEGVSVRQNLLPFQNYMGQKSETPLIGSNNSQSLNQSSRAQSAGFRGQMSGGMGMPASSNPSSIVTSTTSVFCNTTETTSYQSVSSNMSTMSVNSNMGNTSHQQQQSASEEQSMMFLSEEDQLTLRQQGVQLPKLGPNHMLALIGGQVYVVNDDTAEQASVTQPPVTYSTPSAVQNIGQHQVVIQHIAPQQPASETELNQASLPPNMSSSQITPTQTAVDQSALQQQQNLILQQQNLLLHQQMLQQQQQQQGLQQQQQQQHQQQVLQQLAHVAASAGLDINAPGVLELLLRQVSDLQGQGVLQTAGTSASGTGADLNDDDLEEDGDSQRVRNISENRTNKPSAGHASRHQNKKQRACSGKGKVLYEEEEMEYVEGQVDEDSRIPVFVNEVTVGEESNDSDSSMNVQSERRVHYTLKNGSFGNDIASDDDGESR